MAGWLVWQTMAGGTDAYRRRTQSEHKQTARTLARVCVANCTPNIAQHTLIHIDSFKHRCNGLIAQASMFGDTRGTLDGERALCLVCYSGQELCVHASHVERANELIGAPMRRPALGGQIFNGTNRFGFIVIYFENKCR